MMVFDKKGISLIVVIVIMAIIVFITLAVIPQAINESQTITRLNQSIRAFYAAESGINRALRSLISENWEEEGWDTTNPDLYTLPIQALYNSNGVVVGYYTVEVNLLDPQRPVVESVGYSPTTADAKRSIRATFVKTGISQITSAIESTGNIIIMGDAEIEGAIRSNVDFSFKEVFGISKESMKSMVDVIIDPSNNYQPVSGTTWFELVENNKVCISSNEWYGNGIMIVEGDIQITGGEFDGIIWVIGDLDIAGNAEVNGAIFVDGDARITGTSEIEYDEDAIEEAIDNANPPIPSYSRTNWKQIYK